MTARDNLKRKAIITKFETDWENYKKARNETNTRPKEIITPKKSRQVNTLLGKHNQPTKVNELNVNDMKLTSPNDIADGSNTFFSNIGPNLDEKIG